MPDSDLIQRQLRRERRAREQAEALLEAKSRDLYRANHELQQVAADLRRQAELTAAILNGAAEAIITFDDRGVIESFNPAAERVFGYQTAEAIGLPVARLIAPLADGRSAVEVEQVQTSGETQGLRKNAERFPMTWSVNGVQLENRRIFAAIARDRTQHKLLEMQLAHAQKMESVGQLAAGIAHEINTPIQYVGDNIRFLRESFDKLAQLLDAYDRLLEVPSSTEASEPRAALARLTAEIDLDFLRDEIPQAIVESIEGTDRVAKIVRAMKDFSHPGTEEKTYVDIHHAIENTITVSRNEWKYASNVITDFDPELQQVPCLPGEFNQAMLNLIVNAAHAIADANKQQSRTKGEIRIATRRHGDVAEIRVQDTGTGIPAAVQPRIFDPFFTTKPVGVGTGQGLAITYSAIVEKHGGAIRFETEMGVGTTFILELPLSLKVTEETVGLAV